MYREGNTKLITYATELYRLSVDLKRDHNNTESIKICLVKAESKDIFENIS